MIFKHLFRSKHQSPDPQVRLQAIENLNKQDPQQKSVLHELAFNDSDVNVSLAALNKLDSFVLWHKMSEIAKNERVQKKSLQFVENTLLDGENEALSVGEKRAFMLETRDLALVEKLLAQPNVQLDTELAMGLLQKADKPQLQERILFATQNEQLQISLVQTLTDSLATRKLLNKVLKKVQAKAVKELASATLQEWLAAEQAPVQIEQQVRMVLSRLLALKDHGDLKYIEQQQAEFKQQYVLIAQDFACLSPTKRAEIEQKYSDICERVNRTVAMLTPLWQAQQAELILSRDMHTLIGDVEQNLAELSNQLATRISEISASEVEVFMQKVEHQTEQLRHFTHQLPAAKQDVHKRLEQLNNQLLSSLNTLASLPKFQQAIGQCQTLIEKFAGLALPDDASQIEAAQDYLKEQKRNWRDAVASYQRHVPTTLSNQWNEHLAQWQQAVKGLKKQVDIEVARCRNKLRAVESLINQGKYKAAMGLYQKVQNWYSALPEQQQAQLERNFTGVKDQIENLKDWQDYIAAPRKPALLTEVQDLIANPLAVDAQATTIKSLRSQWNSLGKTDTESDQALNLAFDSAIELAFAPCREFYDQQQTQREQNMLAKQQVLTEIKAMDAQQGDVNELAKQLRSVQQKWKNIGEVDYKQRNALYDTYQQALQPLRDKVSTFYQDNAEQKQSLITQAEKLLALESASEAVEQAKRLQQKWKTIEHAGKKAESELWSSFRKVNDRLFAKNTEANLQQKNQFKEQLALVKEQVLQLESSLDKAHDKACVQNALQDKQLVLDGIATLPIGERRALEQRVQMLVEQQQAKLAELVKVARGQAYQDLFSSLREWRDENQVPASVNSLNKQWQQCFRYPLENGVRGDRSELTIKMEIVAQHDSPKQDAKKRQGIQMQLMAQKLQSGDNQDLTALLRDWIKVGGLSDDDLALLTRIEPIFVR